MDLVGAWLRQLLNAGTAAALVPAAMVGALVVVLIGAGGVGGLGSLGQLLSGPQVTPAERVASRDPGSGRDVAPVAPADADADEPRRSGAQGARRRSARPPAAADAPRGPALDPGAAPTVRPPLPPVIEPPPPPPPPPPATPRQPTLKERTQVLEDKLTETVGDVGTAVQEIVDGLEQTLGRIVDPPPRLAP